MLDYVVTDPNNKDKKYRIIPKWLLEEAQRSILPTQRPMETAEEDSDSVVQKSPKVFKNPLEADNFIWFSSLDSLPPEEQAKTIEEILKLLDELDKFTLNTLAAEQGYEISFEDDYSLKVFDANGEELGGAKLEAFVAYLGKNYIDKYNEAGKGKCTASCIPPENTENMMQSWFAAKFRLSPESPSVSKNKDTQEQIDNKSNLQAPAA